ncbi:hypothetical protein M3Y96_01248000 [Aphelenchoides besseyi]|nr:hypothetical protein M3Y96_01248000 [Aphelenchoides besseyi]
MNSNVRGTGFVGLSEIEAMVLVDAYEFFSVEILPLNEFQSELRPFCERTLPMFCEFFRRIHECQSRPDELCKFSIVLAKVAHRTIVQVVDKVERSLQSNNDKEDMNSELPKSLLDKFRDFNKATRNLGIPALKAIFHYESWPKETGA